MQLDRNSTSGGNKYALVRMRALRDDPRANVQLTQSQYEAAKKALALLDAFGLVDFGKDDQSEFFVIKLQDKFSSVALAAYGRAAMEEDAQYGSEVLKLAEKALLRVRGRFPD